VDIHQFSDETQYGIDFQFSPDAVQQREAFSSLADCATVTEDWFTQNRVKTNMDKSILMYVSSASYSSQLESLPLQVGDNFLAPSLIARNLGVSIDSTLSMTPQVKDVCRKAIFQLRWIGKVRKYLTKAAAKSLVQALVLSNFDYAYALLFGLPNELVERLEKNQCSSSCRCENERPHHFWYEGATLASFTPTHRLQADGADIQMPEWNCPSLSFIPYKPLPSATQSSIGYLGKAKCSEHQIGPLWWEILLQGGACSMERIAAVRDICLGPEIF
jgi:hypothetical protein